MITKNYLHIFKVNHRGLKDGELVVARNVQEAIKKFTEYYEVDIDIFPDGITGVIEHCYYEVIDESEKYE